MPLRAKLFIALVIAAGAAILVVSLLGRHQLRYAEHFSQCLILALLASTFKVKLPGMKNTIAASFVLFLIALDALEFNEVIIIAVLSCLTQCLWRPKTRPKAVQVAFNLASTTSSIALALGLTSGLRAAHAVLPELVLASAVFFAVNSGLSSAVVALVRGQRLLELWSNCHRWAFPYYLMGSILSVAVVLTQRVSGWTPALAMLPLMYMIYLCYGQWLAPKLAAEQAAS
jgi:hypothetical protein